MSEPAKGKKQGTGARGAAAYEAMFAGLAGHDTLAFVPFTVLGDPDPATSLEIVRTLARSGASALEVGIPFSDPVADGPSIQAADVRALRAGVHVQDVWQLLATVRQEFPALPIGLLVYANLVLHGGTDGFYARAAAAGVDSVLVADAPLRESAPFVQSADTHGIAPVFIAAPNVPDATLRQIASRSRGYVYVTSRPGVTGADTNLRSDAAGVISSLRSLHAPAALLGFGISEPAHVHAARSLGAAGAIAGSAVADRIARYLHDRAAMLASIEAFVHDMAAAGSRGR